MRIVPWLLTGALLAACQTVPYTGRSRLMLVGQDDMRRMGAEAYRDILKKAALADDTEAAETLRRVGRRLAAQADRPDFDWEFHLIKDDETVNAFCLPGGKVAFYTGILPVTRGEEGIAVVMSHEIAHALARHGDERMSQGLLANLGGAALSVALADKPAQTQAVFADAYGLGVNVGLLLPYSRAHESEADKIGLILMAKAGYDPAEALAFWKRMEEAAGGRPDDPLSRFLATHPSSEERQRLIREWLPEIREKYGRR